MTIGSFLLITAYKVEPADVMVYESICLSDSIARMLNTRSSAHFERQSDEYF